MKEVKFYVGKVDGENVEQGVLYKHLDMGVGKLSKEYSIDGIDPENLIEIKQNHKHNRLIATDAVVILIFSTLTFVLGGLIGLGIGLLL